MLSVYCNCILALISGFQLATWCHRNSVKSNVHW